MTPDLVRSARKLEEQPFHLIAAHSQRKDQGEVVAYLRSQGLPPTTPNFTVTDFGSHPGVQSSGYVPYYLVFDHHGNLVHDHTMGSHHGGDGAEAWKWVDRLLRERPPIYLGDKPFAAVPDLAAEIAAKKKLSQSLTDLEKRLRADPDDATRAELERILAGVRSHRDVQLARAEGEITNAPKRVLPRLRALAKDLNGSSLAADVTRRLATLEKSPELKQAVKVDEAFGTIARGLEKRRSCTQCRLDAILKVRIDCPACRAENRSGFEKAEKQLRALIKANPGLSVTRRVEAYLKSLAPAGDSP